MNPILADIYSTILPSAPFIIAAYVILWLILLAYVVGVACGLKKAETQVALLEKQMDRSKGADLKEVDGSSSAGLEPQ